LIEQVLRASREKGYVYFEGLACWLMGECLAAEVPTAAAEWVEIAIRIFERIDARNDLAKAIVTRASLLQKDGDVAMARQLLERADAIFRALGTLDEPVRVEAARAALHHGAAIPLLGSSLR
jgi:hypothetical protein